MRRLANAVTEHPVRFLLGWLLVVAAVGFLTSPAGVVQRDDVMKADQTDFLPGRYESVRAFRLQEQAFPAPAGATSTIVIRRADRGPLTAADVHRAAGLVAGLPGARGVSRIATGPSGLSPNRKVVLGSVVFDRTRFDQLLTKDVDGLRDRTDRAFAGPGPGPRLPRPCRDPGRRRQARGRDLDADDARHPRAAARAVPQRRR